MVDATIVMMYSSSMKTSKQKSSTLSTSLCRGLSALFAISLVYLPFQLQAKSATPRNSKVHSTSTKRQPKTQARQKVAPQKSKGKSKPQQRKPRLTKKQLAVQKAKLALRPFVRTFAPKKAQKKRGKSKQQSFPASRKKQWLLFLQTIRKHLHDAPIPLLNLLRSRLELVSDEDRNQFIDFPDQLTMKIIHTILQIDAQKRLRKQRRIQKIHQKKGLPKPKKSNMYTLGYEGNLPKISSWGSLIKPRKKGQIPESKLPPLVFTQKDLARYKQPKRFLVWPVVQARISSGYGWRRDPFSRKRRFHTGIDLGAAFGTRVRAAASGRVVRTGWMGACGLGVVIRHPRLFATYYCHLSQILVQTGSRVKATETIGRIGSTGSSTGPHLHFTLTYNNRHVNPIHYLPN